jgi:hypothetical protein
MNPWRTPKRVGRRHLFNPPANLGSGGRPASPTARQFGQPRPESAEPFALPPHDGVRLYVKQWATPAVPNSGQTDPEPSIEGRQNRPFAFSPEGCELQAESGVLHSDCSLTAHQEPNESKDR